MSYKKLSSYVLIMLILTMAFPMTANAQTDAAVKTKPEGKVRIDENNAVWQAYYEGSWDVFHIDISTGTENRITVNPNTQGNPAIWGKYIVWQDDREHAGALVSTFDIYLYDMDSKTETKISNTVGNHQEPVISDNQAVWINQVDGKRQVWAYDISSGSLRRISSENAQAFGLVFDGCIAAWMDCRGKTFDIYMADTATGIEKQVTYGPGDEVDPLVSEGKIAWMVNYNGISQVYMYDSADGLTTKLTVGEENHRPLAFQENTMIIREGSQLVVNSIDRIIQQPLKAPEGVTPVQIFLQGSNIIWFDGQRFIKEPLNTAVARAAVTPAVPDAPGPATPQSGTSHKTPQNTSQNTAVQDKKLVKAGEDIVITSDDGRMSLKIVKGTFEKNTYIGLYQEAQINKEYYIPVTPVYHWEIEGGIKPLKPMELTISYKNTGLGTDVKKLCIYKIEQDGSLQPILAKRNGQNEILIAPVYGDGKAALAAYCRKFSDTEKHWANNMIEVIASHRIIDGYQDGSFKPDNRMTRAEFVKILVSSLASEELETTFALESPFKDIAGDYWAKEYINLAYKKGWINGYDGKFNPGDAITREQMIAILIRVLKDADPEGAVRPESTAGIQSFIDSQKVSPWAWEAIDMALKYGIIQGSGNEIKPAENATRAEAVTMLYRYLDKLSKL